MEGNTFRYLVVLAALVGVWWIIRLLRQNKIQGLEFILWQIGLISVCLISLFPAEVVEVFKLFPLAESTRYDRLIQMSFLFSFFIVAVIFYYRGKIHDLRTQFARSIQDPIVRSFVRANKAQAGQYGLLVLMPALNEGENIGQVLSRIPQEICGLKTKALVVSDGSNDNTLETAQLSGAWAVEHPTNFGGGLALKTAYKIALQMKPRFIVTVDADGQYQPEQIERLIQPLIDGEADVTSGSRTLGEYEQKFQKRHRIRSIGVMFFNHLLTLLTGQRITDSSSGMRAIGIESLHLLNMQQHQFHSSEFLLESIKNNLRFKEVGISFKSRISGDSKKPATLKYGIGFTGAVLRSWMRKRQS